MKTSKINDSKLLDLIRSNKLSLNAPWKLFKIPLSLLKKKFLTFNDNDKPMKRADLRKVSQLMIKNDSKERKTYDPKMIENALNLIMKSKLSIRGASKLFKLPFSLLRNRLISARSLENDVPMKRKYITSSKINELANQNDLNTVSELLIQNDDTQINRIKRKYTRRNIVNGNASSQMHRIKRKYTRRNFEQINRIKRTYNRKSLVTENSINNKNTSTLNAQINIIQKSYTKGNRLIIGNPSEMYRTKRKYTRRNLEQINLKYTRNRLVTDDEDDDDDDDDDDNSSIKSTIEIDHVVSNGNPKERAQLIITERKLPVETSLNNSSNTCLFEIHQSTETNDKPKNIFKCLNCNKMFSELKQLHIHKDLTCRPLNETPAHRVPCFRCYFCMKSFLSKFKFMSHTLLCSSINSL